MKTNGRRARAALFSLAFSLSIFSAVRAARAVKILPPLPDLTIERANYDKAGQQVTINLVNKGQTQAPACLLTLDEWRFKDAKTIEKASFNQSIPALGPGARYKATFDLAQDKVASLKATVDSAKVVRESNEKNNEWSYITGGSIVVVQPSP